MLLLDPALFANGVYQLRLSAWDLVGRTTTINARLIIDTAQKSLPTTTATDATYVLGGHSLALNRSFDAKAGAEFGNWVIAALDTRLSTDQNETTTSGAIAPWRTGARVWLQVPGDYATANVAQNYLSFTLGTTSERLGSEPGAPVVWHPVFSNSQGWTLEAHGEEDYISGANASPDALQRQGHELYSQLTGLPWVPSSYTLTGPDGTRTTLDAHGKVTGVTFADGAQWLVSDAGIAVVGNDTAARVDFSRDSAGRIARITGPGDTASSDAKTTVYRYDTQGRLILARALNAPDLGTPYGYDAAGLPLTDTLTANLGTALNWNTGALANGWSGILQAGTPTSLAFSLRESEIASTVKMPGVNRGGNAGVAGAVIVAIEAELSDPQGSLQVTGATVLGSSTNGNVQTTLVRITEAGLKLIRLSGSGAATLRLKLAGDLDQDGVVDAADSQAWEQASSNTAGADINGDGQITQTDRQVLYANFGLKANQAPVALNTTGLKTHTDLSTRASLQAVAQDLEGDSLFWRILGATHGTARLSGDGQNLLFTPDMGYAGQATITVQADDGFAASAPIALTVNVSGAKLLAIHLAPLPSLRPGSSVVIKATADFADEKGVDVSASSRYLTVSRADLAGMGLVGAPQVQVDDSRDLVRAIGNGPALVIVTRIDTDGRTVRAVAAVNAADNSDGSDPLIVQPDVYPGTLALVPGGTRQLKVHLLDPNTGETTDIHTGSQTVFAGTPESIEQYLDPATQDPLLDPVTGEVMYDPDTGEVLLDPNSGVIVQYVIPAVAPVYSGTRYIVSDESIATVSDSGLITALRDGQVTISIIHLASVTDAYGTISQQVVGQSDITLMVQAAQVTDEDDATPAPRSIVVSKNVGGVVGTATGETVMIGAGALRADTAVSIARINVADMAALPGLPIPGAGVLQLAGAFKLDLGSTASTFPVQLAVPLQAGITADAGTEVLFFRKGQVITADGSFKPTWWLVDNGFVGADGIARTASKPLPCIDTSGEYMVCTRIPGVIGGMFDLGIGGGGWADFGNFCLGGGISGVNIQSEVIGILATMAGSVGGGSYHFGVPQFSQDIVIPTIPAGDTFTLDLPTIMPTAVTPYGNVVLPTISAASINDAGEMHITLDNSAPGQFKGTIVLRALLPDGSTRDVQTFAGDTTGDITITPPGDLAIGSVSWQLVRKISQQEFTGSAELSETPPAEFAGNTLRISPKPLMAAVLNRTGITFMREQLPVGSTNLVGMLGSPNNFGGTYLTGTKVQPVTYSDDLSRVYVAGNGVIYVVDTLSYKLLKVIEVPAGTNIVSLATVGGLLFIGEGNNYGSAPSHARLLVMRTTPGSEGYNLPITVKGTGIEDSPLGVAGMAIGADGRTLVVAVPRQRNGVSLGDPSKRGDILVFDVDSLNYKTGKIDAPIKAELPANSSGGKAPQTITATNDPDHFLVADVADYNRGLATLVLTRDSDDKVTAAKMASIDMSQPGGAVRIDRLDIQRAQSAVLAEKDGVEYAIVSDDNYHFLDPYWKAMYEAPMFTQLTPAGPPTPIGGSASAKKVAVGGKLGIIKDPFGANPQFMGATLPLDGYGIVNLSLSPDGKVLIGQLKGGYSANLDDSWVQKANQNHAWNVDLLLKAAMEMPDSDRMSKHIKLDASAELLLPNTAGGYLGMPVGTFFDAPNVEVKITDGRIGDVIGVDLPRKIATQLLLAEKAISEVDAKTPWDKLSTTTQTLINTRAAKISVTINHDDLMQLTAPKDPSKPQIGMSLVTDGKDAKGNPIVLSRKNADGSGGAATFGDPGAGVLFLTPDLSQDDMANLRAGQSLKPKLGHLTFTYVDNANPGASAAKKSGKGKLDVSAEEPNAAGRVFMGDRPLDNPGYSAITFSAGSVGNVVTALDKLDTLKLEHRLKYFGFGVSAITGNTEEITEDGKLSASEQITLRMFDQIVFGKTEYEATTTKTVQVLTPNGWTTKTQTVPLAPMILLQTDVNWLNAYNAPHWMSYSGELKTKLTGWVDMTKVDTTKAAGTEKMGTSWVFDLMLAAQKTNDAQGRGKLADEKLWFNGAGSLGAMLDLGINTKWVSKGTAGKPGNQDSVNGKDRVLGVIPDTPSLLILNPTAFNNKQWDYSNAQALALRLRNPNIENTLPGDKSANSTGENQQDQALRDFYSIYLSSLKGDAATNKWSTSQLGFIGSAQGDARIKIQEALFGSGVQSGGLIDSKNVLLGGTAAPLGAMMTSESLAQFMNPDGKITGVDYSQWVKPLQDAMVAYDISTPQQIAAFMAQVKQETGGLKKMKEEIGPYRVRVLIDTFSGMFGGKSLTREQRFENLKIFMKNVLGLTALEGKKLSDAGIEEYKPSQTDWDTVKDKFADYYLSEDKGTAGIPKGNGNAADAIAHNWIGRGFLHVTHFASYVGFFYDLSRKYPDLIPEFRGQTKAQIEATLKANPSLTDRLSENSEQGRQLAALAGAWFWGTHGNLNDKASTIVWQSDRVDQSQEPQFNQISSVINQGDAFPARWENYRNNAAALLKGGNPYENMRAVLARLGVTTAAAQNYNQQFGITLAQRKPLAITSSQPNHLMASATQALTASPQGLDLTAEQEAQLWAQAEPLFEQLKSSPEEKSTMWIPDLRSDAAWLTGAAIAVAAVSPAQAADKYVLGMCQTATQSEGVEIRPIGNANSYLYTYQRPYALQTKFDFDSDDTKVTLIKAPKQGQVALADVPDVANGQYHYMPNDGYFGRDNFVMQVEKDGVKVRIQYLIEVLEGNEPSIGVCKSAVWKISQSTSDTSGDNLAAWQRASDLYSLLATASQTLTGFADLPGSAVGNAVGEGTTAAITLDTTAAGNGWYIDPTPLDNTDDYLPTSNPNEWIAKAGTDAAGKMDMLSVLLHEYGHALGLEHSADARDFMATTLTPGVRRLPSADELTLMSQLVAQLKTDSSDAQVASHVPAQPDAPSSPLPGLPFTGLGLFALGRLRSDRYGLQTLFAPNGSTLASVPQYEVAANATLTNGQFDVANGGLNAAQGWASEGSVAIASGNAVLSESATRQTRLNQVFMLGAQDRYLSFTLSGIALDDQANGPDDAFEVALLDANSGASLTGAIGLTHTDALLNLQANGTELAASGVTHVTHPDGSRTYLLDLSGMVPANSGAMGRAVNLSFDLIGFGANGSHVSISDVRLLGQPQTTHDSSTLAEDTVAQIIVLANDTDAQQPGFAPVIVAAPAHGQVEVNADGSFNYTPAKDYFGPDSFSYKVSNGVLDSNVATVSLSITPVNDAPVAADVDATVLEDNTVAINLIAADADNTGTELQFVIETQPAHGNLVQNTDGSFSYTPAPNFNGTDSFTYTVTDGALVSNVATARINVTAVNDAPVLPSRNLSLNEDASIVIDPLAGAIDPDGDPLGAQMVAGPSHGTLSVNADGSFSYTPDANYFGADSFSYTVTDGELVSNTATVQINITPVNDAPVARDLDASLAEDGFVVLDIAALASDADGGTLNLSVGATQHGSLVHLADGRYRYTPVADFFGTDSFSYTLTDGTASALGVVRLVITPVNDAPVGAADSATLLQGESVTIDVLANDSDVDTPLDALHAVIVGEPANGVVQLNADGTFTYTPNASYFGADSFSYVLTDGSLQSTPVTVSLTVVQTNEAPVFTSTPPLTLTLGTSVVSDSVFQPTNQAGAITTSYRITERQSSSANEVGYFRVDDTSGRIGDLLPGDAGYAQAALSASRATTLFNGQAGIGSKAASTLAAGQHVGFYLIQNATLGTWSEQNSANDLGGGPLAFFSFDAANPDGAGHLQATFASENGSGKLTLKWEDQTGGGTGDFNDLVITATGFKSVSTVSTEFIYDAQAIDPEGGTITYSLGSAPIDAVINSQTGLIRWSAVTDGSYTFSVNATDGECQASCRL